MSGSHGGSRRGAGRKPALTAQQQEEICADYLRSREELLARVQSEGEMKRMRDRAREMEGNRLGEDFAHAIEGVQGCDDDFFRELAIGDLLDVTKEIRHGLTVEARDPFRELAQIEDWLAAIPVAKRKAFMLREKARRDAEKQGMVIEFAEDESDETIAELIKDRNSWLEQLGYGDDQDYNDPWASTDHSPDRVDLQCRLPKGAREKIEREVAARASERVGFTVTERMVRRCVNELGLKSRSHET